MNGKDVGVGLLAAVAIGLLSYPTILNLEVVSAHGRSAVSAVSFVLFVLTLIGLACVKFLSRWWAPFWQMGKFIVVGGLNTFLDFAILNLLMSLTSIMAGLGFAAFKTASFSAAVANSYFWNKHWTFEVGHGRKTEFVEFVLVSLVGLGINVGSAFLAVGFISPLWGMPALSWANFSAFIATVLALAWNFIGYKFFVFRHKS